VREREREPAHNKGISGGDKQVILEDDDGVVVAGGGADVLEMIEGVSHIHQRPPSIHSFAIIHEPIYTYIYIYIYIYVYIYI
jgi:hypothetical protein